MSYHLYHTDAFVLGGVPSGEGSRYLTILTREFGLITAKAQSVREERSKLRYGLQDFSFSSVTLVRGKEFWRVTSVSSPENLYVTFRERRECAEMIARVFSLLRRLLAGEEKNERLFINLVETVAYLTKTPLSAQELSSVEIVLVLRILHTLGYLAPRNEFSVFFDDAVLWGDTILHRAASLRSLALSDINTSLQHSQL